MSAIRMTYASRQSQQFSLVEMASILEASSRNNPGLDITGLLFLGNGYFFQCLEGPREQVNQLYRKLLHDPRHEDVQILEVREMDQRYFAGWSMKYIAAETMQYQIIQKLGMQEFDPYKLNTAAIDRLLKLSRGYYDTSDNGPSAAATAQPRQGFLGWLRR